MVAAVDLDLRAVRVGHAVVRAMTTLPPQRSGWSVPCVGGPDDGRVLIFAWPTTVPEALFKARRPNAPVGRYVLGLTKRGPRFNWEEDRP
jgi:hypothetical protein